MPLDNHALFATIAGTGSSSQMGSQLWSFHLNVDFVRIMFIILELFLATSDTRLLLILSDAHLRPLLLIEDNEEKRR